MQGAHIYQLLQSSKQTIGKHSIISESDLTVTIMTRINDYNLWSINNEHVDVNRLPIKKKFKLQIEK